MLECFNTDRSHPAKLELILRWINESPYDVSADRELLERRSEKTGGRQKVVHRIY